MKKIVSLLMLLCLCLSLMTAVAEDSSAQLSSFSYEGEGFATPQEAATNYLEGLQALDYSKMIRSFAIESYAINVDLKAELTRLHVFFPTTASTKFPGNQEFFININTEARKNEVVMDIYFQFLTLFAPGIDASKGPIILKDENSIDEFMALFPADASGIAQTIVIGECLDPFALNDMYVTEDFQNVLEQRRQVYGADEIQSVPIWFSLHDKFYILGCDAVRYGEKWYLVSLTGNFGLLLDIPSASGSIIGGIVEVSRELIVQAQAYLP